MSTEVNVKRKTHFVVPRDVMDFMHNKFASFAEEKEAEESAQQRCGESGMTHYVVSIASVAVRENPPVKLRKLK